MSCFLRNVVLSDIGEDKEHAWGKMGTQEPGSQEVWTFGGNLYR